MGENSVATAKTNEMSLSLENVIATAVQIPGVKVERNSFLREMFKDSDESLLTAILEKGPVEAGCDRELLKKKAHKIVQTRTAFSTGASFAAGLPGGFAMAAAIPADILQFYGVALRMAQELAYLYGEEDLWDKDFLDRNRVTNQLILYCGVMLGASGAVQSVRILSSALAKQALKKLPQKALTKTFYYPVIKSIARFFGVSMTKSTFAKGISKVVPVIGGVVSGSITLATMAPMGKRLEETLEQVHFDYTEASFHEDWDRVMEMAEQEEKENQTNLLHSSENTGIKKKASSLFNKLSGSHSNSNESKDPIVEQIQQAKQLLDEGALTEEEYQQLKNRLLKS